MSIIIESNTQQQESRDAALEDVGTTYCKTGYFSGHVIFAVG